MYKPNFKNFSSAGIIPVLVLCAILSSCGVLDPVATIPVTEYQLLNTPVSISSECNTKVNSPILQVSDVRADAPLNTRYMYYSQEQYQLNHYANNQWASYPATMLTSAIVEKLLAGCIYGNVINSDTLTTAHYRLNSRLLNYKQVITHTTISVVNLSVLVQVVDNSSNKVIQSKIFSATSTVEPTVKGYVKGSHEVVQTFLNDLESWLMVLANQ